MQSYTYFGPPALKLAALPRDAFADPIRRRESNWWLLIAALCLLMPACKSATAIMPNTATNIVRSENADDAKTLDTTTKKIQADAIDAQKKTPAALQPAIGPDLNDILVNTGTQAQLVENLKERDAQIAATAKQIDDLSKQLKAAQDEITVAKQSLNVANNKIGMNFEVFGGIGLALSIALIIVGGIYLGSIAKDAGMAMGVACASAVCIGLMITSVQPLIPWIVGAVAAVAIGFAIYFIWSNRKAISEIVQTAEVAKQILPAAARQSLFGNGAIPGHADTIQSASTQSIVSAARAIVPNAPPIAPVDSAINLAVS